nr:MAG TPA: hypothetical protein [Caudoviricetes sp.]
MRAHVTNFNLTVSKFMSRPNQKHNQNALYFNVLQRFFALSHK